MRTAGLIVLFPSLLNSVLFSSVLLLGRSFTALKNSVCISRVTQNDLVYTIHVTIHSASSVCIVFRIGSRHMQ